MRKNLGVALGLGMVLLGADTVLAQDDRSAPLAATPHFAFHSDIATNLNDALVVAGSARNDDKPELFHAGSEEGACFAELPPSVRAGWDLAVDYYARIISPVSWMKRQQYLLRVDLAGFDDEVDARARGFFDIARGFRAAALPAYEACRWSSQDAENRRWIDALTPRLAAHESAIAGRLEELYQVPWHGLPIRVDVVATAPAQGANSLISPPHILVSSSIEEGDALEIVHHEASHTLMSRNDPVRQAFADAARELDLRVPGDLWHVVLFYTSGEAVRRTLDEAGQPDYSPFMYAHDLWDGRWGGYREAIEDHWPAYLDGTRTLPEAATDLLQSLAVESDGPGRQGH
jgi:hypothetical protein